MRSAGSSAKPARFRADDLSIGGLVPFSATDYPGALACVVFLQGCPWRCGYCHNPHLIPAAADSPLAWEDVLAWLRSRRGLLDAVVFSGGEPLAQPALALAMRAARSLGFAIGLHTGGAYPRRFAEVLPLADWVGLDVKAPRERYATVTAIRGSGDAAWKSVDLALDANASVELRTTVHAQLTPPEALERVACELHARGVGRWVLQPFRAQGCANASLAAAGPVLDDALVARLSRYVAVEIRG